MCRNVDSSSKGLMTLVQFGIYLILELYHSYIHVISLKREPGRFCCHFREVFQKCMGYIEKLLIQIRENFLIL